MRLAVCEPLADALLLWLPLSAVDRVLLRDAVGVAVEDGVEVEVGLLLAVPLVDGDGELLTDACSVCDAVGDADGELVAVLDAASEGLVDGDADSEVVGVEVEVGL